MTFVDVLVQSALVFIVMVVAVFVMVGPKARRVIG
jgi:hypothetical protein